MPRTNTRRMYQINAYFSCRNSPSYCKLLFYAGLKGFTTEDKICQIFFARYGRDMAMLCWFKQDMSKYPLRGMIESAKYRLVKKCISIK